MESFGGLVSDAGWSAHVGDASFKGEISYYQPTFNDQRDQGYTLASVAGSYTFSNSLRVHLEGIYNGNDQRLNFSQLINSSGLQANNLSMFEYGIYGQVGYDVHPLVRVNLGHIYYPDQALNLLSPSISYSVGSNWELYGLAQLFMGRTSNLMPESRSNATSLMNLMSLRVQWSF